MLNRYLSGSLYRMKVEPSKNVPREYEAFKALLRQGFRATYYRDLETGS
jgi:hypothetical protein